MPSTNRKFRWLVSALCAMVMVTMVAGTVFAQSSNGSVRSPVRDQTDAVIPGARFTLDAFNVFNDPTNRGNNGAQDYMTSAGILDTRGQSNPARQLQIS